MPQKDLVGSGSGSGSGNTLPYFLRVEYTTFELPAVFIDERCIVAPDCLCLELPPAGSGSGSGSGVAKGNPEGGPEPVDNCDTCVPNTQGEMTVPAWFSPPGFVINYTNNTVTVGGTIVPISSGYEIAAIAWSQYCQANCDNPNGGPGGGAGGGPDDPDGSDTFIPAFVVEYTEFEIPGLRAISKRCVDEPICDC